MSSRPACKSKASGRKTKCYGVPRVDFAIAASEPKSSGASAPDKTLEEQQKRQSAKQETADKTKRSSAEGRFVSKL